MDRPMLLQCRIRSPKVVCLEVLEDQDKGNEMTKRADRRVVLGAQLTSSLNDSSLSHPQNDLGETRALLV